ncbi:D-dopachrome decarboxylase [Toxotes jaculatrix]|uniref:D-dopachrome decarboxylase n=1 Tax=Toxotes jaculatrix TaxID=941984 RepID=UPI001B3A8A80|nr:D-dopachrome decarboxylase [Toxotes jaculatrix]
MFRCCRVAGLSSWSSYRAVNRFHSSPGLKMPFIDLQSNLPASSFSEDFVKKLGSSTAAALGKPEDRMNVVVNPGLPMLIAGSCSPCVMLSVSAIGATDSADKNKEHSAKIFEFLTKELGLTEDRIVIQFHALQPHQVGKNGTVISFL